MFSFFCTRQASKGGSCVCLEEESRGVTILVPDSKDIEVGRSLTILEAADQRACQRPWGIT